MSVRSEGSLLEAVVKALHACDTAPDGVAPPAAILWTDPKEEWRSVARLLHDRLPELITIDEYRPGERVGPAIWARCVIAGTLQQPAIPADRIPIVYMPGVARQTLRAGQDCPWAYQPLIELMFRGTMWLQRSGQDWTVTAFLTSDAALGLDIAGDQATRQALHRALSEVAVAPLAGLRGRRLQAADFDSLLTTDPVRDLLRWMSDPKGIPAQLGPERWQALCSQAKSKFGFDPSKDGETAAGERLGLGEGPWASLWARYAEAPAAYPGVPELLRRSKPMVMGLERSRWPDENSDAEADLRKKLEAVGDMPHAKACDTVLALEADHGVRRGWLWSRLGQAPLAGALRHLARLAERARTAIGGSVPNDFITPYTDTGWEADAAAWQAMAAAATGDEALIGRVVAALLVPWMDDSAKAFQQAVAQAPLEGKGGEPFVRAGKGTCLLFADGLRYDLARLLEDRLRAAGHGCQLGHRWAALPSLTATAKPAVTPVAEAIVGETIPDDFTPAFGSGKPANAGELRAEMKKAGYQVMLNDDPLHPEAPDARGWTEFGKIDELGHKLEERLAGSISGELDQLQHRIQQLLEAGWSSVRIVTDHGWLYCPGGLPKVDLPKYLTVNRGARCAAIKGNSQVQVVTAPWHWNSTQRFATPPGAACFNKTSYYAHGGLSIQECLIPDLTVSSGSGSTLRATIKSITWRKMRCNIEATTAGGGVTADLRLESPAGQSVVANLKPVEADGHVSLVVEDDRYENAALVAVLLTEDGTVLAQRKTKVGASS